MNDEHFTGPLFPAGLFVDLLSIEQHEIIIARLEARIAAFKVRILELRALRAKKEAAS